MERVAARLKLKHAYLSLEALIGGSYIPMNAGSTATSSCVLWVFDGFARCIIPFQFPWCECSVFIMATFGWLFRGVRQKSLVYGSRNAISTRSSPDAGPAMVFIQCWNCIIGFCAKSPAFLLYGLTKKEYVIKG